MLTLFRAVYVARLYFNAIFIIIIIIIIVRTTDARECYCVIIVRFYFILKHRLQHGTYLCVRV